VGQKQNCATGTALFFLPVSDQNIAEDSRCAETSLPRPLSPNPEVRAMNNSEMKPLKRYKIVIFVPETHAAKMREAIGAAGAGVIGNYSHCTFTMKGITRFRPKLSANPAMGEPGQLEEVAEERIETVCTQERLSDVLAAIKAVHPYEEPAPDVYPIEVIGR
jgi:hypothetical protein